MGVTKATVYVVLLSLVAVTSATTNRKGSQYRDNNVQIPGGITDVADTNSLKVNKIVKLATDHLKTHLDKCTDNMSLHRVQSQVVSGTMYFVHIRVGPCDRRRKVEKNTQFWPICKVSVWDQPWIGQPRVHEYTCSKPDPRYENIRYTAK